MTAGIKNSHGIKLGAERKKVIFLSVLLVIFAIVLVVTHLGNDNMPPGVSAPTPAASHGNPAPAAVAPLQGSIVRSASPAGADQDSTQDFQPSFKKIKAQLKDPTQVDPTLRVDELAKLKNELFEGGSRSLFEFSQPSPPKAVEKVKPIEVGPTQAEIAARQAAEDHRPPPPPPIPLKYYGFSEGGQQLPKRAFFIEGENIFVGAEGEIVDKRYKVIRIGVNSVVVEDTTNKNQQTLPLMREFEG